MSVQGQGSVSAVLDAIRTITRMIRSGSLVGPHTHTARKGGPIQTDTTMRFRNALQPMFDSDSQMLNTNLNADLWRGQRYYNQVSKPKYAAKGDLAWDGSSFWVWNGTKWIANQTAFPNEAANQVFAGPTSGAAAAPSFRALVPADIPGLPASIITSGVLPVGFGGTGTGTAFTAGSLVFAGAGGVYSQDNAGLFWDATNRILEFGAGTFGAQMIFENNHGISVKDTLGNVRLIFYGTNDNYFYAQSLGSGLTFANAAGTRIAVILDNGNAGIATQNPKTLLDVRGSFSVGLVTKTANYTMTATDHTVLADASGGAFTVTLPAANTQAGMQVLVAKSDNSVNAVTVAAAGTDTIQGAASKSLSTQYAKSFLESDGVSKWYDLSVGGV